ncbi:MAG: tripartite tricarboxylate transporter TctB family protein [Thermodesulfobacteriota bacterium]
MGRRDLISGAFLMLVSLATCIMAYRLGLGTGGNPGAGFAAFGIAFLLGLMSMGMFVRALTQAHREDRAGSGGPRILWKRPLLTLLVLTGYGAFFHVLGFSLCTFLLMMLLVWGFGRRRPAVALAVSVLTVALSYALFVMALGLPLPMGSVWYISGG